MKKVYKYGTGDTVPEGAIYLCTKVQEVRRDPMGTGTSYLEDRFVWHYFLVEVTDGQS